MWIGFLVAVTLAGPSTPAGLTVAIDPGHGGSNRGAAALTPGLFEKHITLDIARRIQKQVENRPGLKVFLCRDRDVMVPVRARVRCAKEGGAQLFISLHANASPDGPSRGVQHGFELYVAPSQQTTDDASMVALEADNAAAGAWAGQQVIASIADATDAAQRLRWQLSDALGRNRDRGIKQQGAALDVLSGLPIPGVLLEVGFLDHPEDGPLLASEAGRERIAQAIARGLADLAARYRRAKEDPAITAKPALPHP